MQRPTSVTVFGVLNIVFAGFGVFGILASLAVLALTDASRNPVVKIMQQSPAYAAWLKLNIPLGIMGCAALLAAGIGLLLLKGWARKLSIGYAIFSLLSAWSASQ